jgi:ribosomal protein S16
MLKKYSHNVIRLRKGKNGFDQIYWIIVILNKKKTSSHKQIEQLGFFKYGKKRLLSLNYSRLSYYLNKGFLIKKNVKRLIYKYTLLFNINFIKYKYKYRLNKKRRVCTK